MKNLQFKPLPMTEDVPLTSNLIANNKAAKPRRRFTATYKLGIPAEIDACTSKGQIGAILRREGLYSSNLIPGRRQREESILNGLSPRKRGRKAKGINPLAKRVAELERENRKLDKLHQRLG